MSLRKKTIKGLLWSFIDSFLNLSVQFLIGVILARLLSPHEFGLIGTLTFFIIISQIFVEGGFTNALIRKRESSQEDYSTVFFFSLIISIILFALLYFNAIKISIFFAEPQLNTLLKILSFSLIINSLGLVHRTILIKKIDFKTQSKISLISSIFSGIFAVISAFADYGVWSLVILTLSRSFLSTIFFWIYVDWKPSLIFNINSFLQLFGFGGKLLLSGLIDAVFTNSYLLVIGKYFSTSQLGYFTRADQFKSLPSQQLTNIVNRVSYPILAEIQDDQIALKTAYIKLIRSTMFLSFLFMLILSAVSESLLITLLGNKWLRSVEYLQLLCFVGIFYPLHSLNLNMLQVKGRSDLFLRLEIIKKVLMLPVILVGVSWGIKWLIVGMIFNSFVSYYLNSYWSGRLLNYPIIDQIKDILPSFGFAIMVSLPVYLIGYFLQQKSFIELIIQLLLASVLLILLGESRVNRDYIYVKGILFEKLKILRII